MEENAFWEGCEPKAPIDLGSYSSKNAFSSIVSTRGAVRSSQAWRPDDLKIENPMGKALTIEE